MEYATCSRTVYVLKSCLCQQMKNPNQFVSDLTDAEMMGLLSSCFLSEPSLMRLNAAFPDMM